MSLISVKNSKKYNFTDVDNVYVNVDIYNQNSEIIDAVFEVTRAGNILDNPSDYELAIVRFSVPTINIPIMVLDSSKDYKISLDADGTIFTQNVTWISNTNSPSSQFYIRNYQEFIDSLNQALSLLHTSALTAIPPIPTYPNTPAPYFRLDEGGLVNFVIPTLLATDPDIRWYVNSELQAIIPTISYIENINGGNQRFQIVTKDNKNNTEVISAVSYYVMKSESSPLFLWNDFQNLVFTSNSIPIVPELLGTSVQNTRRVLTDFNPPSQEFDRSPLQYFPQGPLRFYNLKFTQPLNTIDLAVSWIDKAGRLFPVKLARYDNLSVKILFKRKNTQFFGYE